MLSSDVVFLVVFDLLIIFYFLLYADLDLLICSDWLDFLLCAEVEGVRSSHLNINIFWSFGVLV